MNIKKFLSEQSIDQKELLQALQQLQQGQGTSAGAGQQAPGQQTQAAGQQTAPATQQKAPAQKNVQQQPVLQQKNQSKKAAQTQAFTPQQEAAIKQIVQKMINDMLKGSVDAKL